MVLQFISEKLKKRIYILLKYDLKLFNFICMRRKQINNNKMLILLHIYVTYIYSYYIVLFYIILYFVQIIIIGNIKSSAIVFCFNSII